MKTTPASLGGNEADQVRGAPEIANRALALGTAVAMSFGADTKTVRSWLRETNVQNSLTDPERRFVFGTKRTERSIVQFTWRAEALLVLLWSIGKVPSLPAPDKQCQTSILSSTLPPFSEVSLQNFLANVQRRSEQELLDLAAEIQDLHAIARQREHGPNFTAEGPLIDLEVIQERHHAINWVVGYCGQSWEQVSTDT